MKVSDYIVEFLIDKGITDVFGYPGGMVTHLMDSFAKYEKQINAHVCYHEQAASFEACAYAQASNNTGVAYATSGPGATNMITGICNAYFDSVPVIFLTGQVNTSESGVSIQVRQRGFQETNIVNMVAGVTKYAAYVEDATKIGQYLETAYTIANQGRKGPVLLDIPMDIQRTEVELPEIEKNIQAVSVDKNKEEKEFSKIIERIEKAERPVILLGAGVKAISKEKIEKFVSHMGMPIVTSMIAMDILPYGHSLNYGFVGAYGSRIANFIVAKSDLVLAIGSRMDIRQVGAKRENFAPNAAIVRIDVDAGELSYKVHDNELGICAEAEAVIDYLIDCDVLNTISHTSWIAVCDAISKELKGVDDKKYNLFIKRISRFVPDHTIITTDVGQNQVWTAQSFEVKENQKVLFSGGHGAMGYSLPAAIGAYYASKTPVISFNGDGGFQMNIQELEFIKRERLPIKVFVFNNYALGMIRHFQEMYFENNFTQTIDGRGYSASNLERIATAYEMNYLCYENVEDVTDDFMKIDGSVLVEIKLKEDTYVFPKLEFGKPNQDQEPLLERGIYYKLMEM